MLLRYSEDRVPVLLILLVFSLDVAVYTMAESWWVAPLWFAAMLIPKGWICAWNHHHQHLPTFRHWTLNRPYELILGLQTGVTSQTWYLHHVVGHHRNYLEGGPEDEATWLLPNGKPMTSLGFAFRTAALSYPIALRNGLSGHRRALRVFATMLLVTLGCVGWALWQSPYNAMFVFVGPMLTSLWLTAWASYFHHAGLDADDHAEASYNILDPGYNLMTGNLGYHTAHHTAPGLHWSKLPALHAKIASSIPDDCYRRPGIPFEWVHREEQILRPDGA